MGKEPLIPTLEHPRDLIGKTITHVQMADYPNDEQFNIVVLDGKYPFIATNWQEMRDILPGVCRETERGILSSFNYHEEDLKWLSGIGIIDYKEIYSNYLDWVYDKEEIRKQTKIDQLSELISEYPDEARQILEKQ